ncbi:MAG TPA: HlyD family efflux transporter periplasmic adaptor subunit [Burkholderiales bacterium]|nr:HlyD family efflux transporter periplasmic adaptor subunit [Burkholderiales bacterium]
MKRWLSLLLFAFIPVAFAGPGAHGPDGEHLDTPGHTHASGAVQRLADGSVSLPKAAQRRMNIRTQIGVEGEHALPVELNGRVIIDPNAGGRVQAPFAGRIDAGPQGIAMVGSKVKRGDVLAMLYPTANALDLGNQRAQLSELRAQREIAEARAERLRQLEGSVARKDIDAAVAEARSLRERERAVGASLSQAQLLRAPVDGVVASANALTGQIVEGRELLFEVVDPAHLLVEAQTADPQLAARISGAALRDVPGIELDFVGGALALRDGALPLVFRLRAAQRTSQLALGQPVTVVAQLNDRIKGIALPSEAVVRSASNQPIVWVKTNPQRFVAQVVSVTPLDAKRVLVTQGLAPDNRVVVLGAPLINQIR